ncbi:DMT family transporter [Marimonas arenosa]|uniref:DMT family transporter n=1 Tax=Marimonas arenosa TaxID=1795305 RepID=A0AAE3WDW2_9RHOB|nr:DMT family transporter [Marimonas arenosa]MDQ2090912.1 DMT family transporter [Marimonas arenosa]
MRRTVEARGNLLGALCAAVAVTCFSVNDVGIKFLSGDYALHQVVLIRSLIGSLVFFVVIMPLSGGWRVMKTRRLGVHMVRGLCVVLANMCFFLGLAALPLADAVAIFFISPLIITVFSVVFLGEHVGPRRWMAIALGFVGVLVIVKPGTSAFQLASLLPIVAAALYATLHTLTRKIGNTESAATMAFYIQLTFVVTSAAIGLALGDGRFAGNAHPSLDFLMRAWGPVASGDYAVLAAIGVTSVAGGYFISQAYRLSEAAFVAPFEYVAMPMAVIWGLTVFGEWPDWTAWAGIAMIVGAGLFLLWREAEVAEDVAAEGPKYRR